MKQFICIDCEETFDEDHFGTSHEDRGEYWGVPCFEDVLVCPYCGSDNFEPYFGELSEYYGDEENEEGEEND